MSDQTMDIWMEEGDCMDALLPSNDLMTVHFSRGQTRSKLILHVSLRVMVKTLAQALTLAQERLDVLGPVDDSQSELGW